MRVWHSAWSWLNERVAADSVAGNTFTGMFTRLTLRKPFQVGLGGILLVRSDCCVSVPAAPLPRPDDRARTPVEGSSEITRQLSAEITPFCILIALILQELHVRVEAPV